MNILIILLLALAAVVVLLLLPGFFMKKEHYVKREIIIDAPREKVFGYLRLLKNQDAFNEHAMTDAGRERAFKGIDGTVGYVYSWSGDKSAGVGEKEIISITEGERIETEIRFIKPMVTSARIIMETESVPGNRTKVSWSNAGRLNYPVNIMIPMMERSVAKGMDASLLNLKKILEKEQ